MLTAKVFLIIGVVSLLLITAAAVLIPYLICRRITHRKCHKESRITIGDIIATDEETRSPFDGFEMDELDMYQAETLMGHEEVSGAAVVESHFYHASLSETNDVEYLHVE